jgi:hypothetical protein
MAAVVTMVRRRLRQMLRHAMLDIFTGRLRGVFCEFPSGPVLPDRQRGTNQRHDLFPEEGNGLS